MSAFDAAIAFVLAREGGYVNDPRDPGGETNFGICRRDFPNVDIADLTAEDASAIYLRQYWAPVHGDDLPPGVALMVMDTAVNMGVGAAVRMLQSVCGVAVDGDIGPKTLAAAAASGVLESYRDARIARYHQLSNFPTYGNGWLNRVALAYAAATSMES